MKDSILQGKQAPLSQQSEPQKEQVPSAQSEQAEENSQSLLIAVVETSLIIAGLLAIGILLPRSIHGDAAIRLQALSQLLEKHTWSAMEYSYIGPLFSIPLWLLGRHFHAITGWIEQYNFLLFTLGLLITYLLLRSRVHHGLLRKFFLILIVASMFPNHLENYYGEVFTAMCVGVGVIWVVTTRFAWVGWSAIILGVFNTPAALVGLTLAVLKYIWDTNRLRYALVILTTALLIASEAWLRRGGAFVSGYETAFGVKTVMPYTGKPGFSYPFFFGLLSILFSFGKGIFFFAPGLLLPVRSTLLKIQQEKKVDLYRIYLLWITFLVGLVLVYSRWWAWYGGWFWGPRFFLIASIPASFAIAVRIHQRNTPILVNLLTAAVLCLSTWVGINGAVFDQIQLKPICQGNNYTLEFLCHYTPDFSALWHPLIVPQHLTRPQLVYIAYSGIVLAYLITPLLVKIVRQVLKLGNSFGKTYLHVRIWRF